MRLSVVVVAYRSAATLGRALDALAANAPTGTELVVVDNAADPSTAACVEARWPGATIVTNDTNRGFGAAVNQALPLTRAELVLLLNPDAEIEAGCLEQLIAAMRARPDAGIVAPRLVDAAGRPVLSCYPFLSLATVAWRHFQLYRVLPNVALGRYRRATLSQRRTEPVPVDWAQGACLLVKRQVFERIGGLDERYFLYCEEVDLCLRAARAGWRTYYVPTARARHAEGSSSGQVVPLKLASHYYSKVLYFDKHLGDPRTVALRGLLLVDLVLRMAFRTYGALSGRPPDARQRLATYAAIAVNLATASPSQISKRWRSTSLRGVPERSPSGRGA
jgi:N-acetylglucosaminyl-diphospho-decaprenol L-rhamnosyltransferase